MQENSTKKSGKPPARKQKMQRLQQTLLVGKDRERLQLTLTARQLQRMGYAKVKSIQQRRYQRPPKPSQQSTSGVIKNQSKQDTTTSVPISNVVATSSVSISSILLGDVNSAQYLIHPSNHILFPNLSAITDNFSAYRIKQFELNCRSIASTLSSGAYLVAASPNLDQFQGTNGPLFSFLANYATSQLACIYKSMKYKLANNIMHRLKQYLISSTDDANSTVGKLYFSRDDTAQAANVAPPPMPITTLVGQIEFHDFKPAQNKYHPVSQLYGSYLETNQSSSSQIFQSRFYAPAKSNPRPTFQASATTPWIWFTLPQPGDYQLHIATQGTKWMMDDIKLSVKTIDNQINPSYGMKGNTGQSTTYNFTIDAPNTSIGCVGAPGWVPILGDQPSFISFALYKTRKATSSSYHTLKRFKHFDLQAPALAPPASIGIPRTPIKIPLDTLAFDRHLSKQPTVRVQIQTKVGYCWLDWLVAAGCTVSQQWDTFIQITNAANSITVENVPFMPIMTLLRIVKSLNLSTLFSTRGLLTHVSQLQGHLQYASQDIVNNTILIDILNYETVGAKVLYKVCHKDSSIQNRIVRTLSLIKNRFSPQVHVRLLKNIFSNCSNTTFLCPSIDSRLSKKDIALSRAIARSITKNRAHAKCISAQICYILADSFSLIANPLFTHPTGAVDESDQLDEA